MPEHRGTIRLDESLYARLEARGSQEQPLAAIVRQVLVDYLARQPAEPERAAAVEEMLAAMAARLDDLHGQVRQLTARVDMMAATWQPIAVIEQESAAMRQPGAARPEQRPRPPARHGLPRETREAIADARTLCEGLSYQEFAIRLHERGIYSATAKDGSKVPANRGTVKQWLDQARAAGLL